MTISFPVAKMDKCTRCCIFKDTAFYLYYVGEKTHTISFFNNSKKLQQILLEFSQQIVEGYEFVLAKFRRKRPFQSTKICNVIQN